LSKRTHELKVGTPRRGVLVHADASPKRPYPDVWPVVIGLLLFAVTLALYVPAARYDFINCDDPDYITNNPNVLGGLTWAGVKWAFAAPHVGNWIPVSWITHMSDVQVFGKQAGGPHVVNALIHALNAVLAFWLLRRVTGSLWRSAFVAALFALHPLRVESVAWVCERRDVLSAFFGLLTLIAYVRYMATDACRLSVADVGGSKLDVRCSRFGVQSPRPALWYVLSLLFFALGLMSKPMVVTVPFLMLLLDYWPLGRLQLDGQASPEALAAALWPRVREKMPFFVLSAVFSVLTVWGQRELGAVPALESLPVPVRIENALVSYARYLAKEIWPANLALQYPYVNRWPLSQVLISLLLIIGVSAWAVRVRRKQPYVLMGWLWFLGALLPVIGLIQAGSQSMADRFTYLPSLGLFILIAWGLPGLLPQTAVAGRVSAALAGLVLVACAWRSHDQLATWQNSGTVFRYAIAASKDNWFARGCLGSYLAQQGQTDAAIEQFQAGLAISPHDSGLLANLAGVLAERKQQYTNALALYEASVRSDPNRADRRGKYAELLTRMGQTDAAMVQYREMLRLNPSDADTHNKLGVVLASQGKLNDAIGQLQQAVQLAPGLAYAHCNLGNALSVQHKYAEAIREYGEALRLDPKYAYAHNNLAGAFEALDRLPDAEQHYREALRLQPDYLDAHVNLGSLLARSGRTNEAVSEFQAALRLQPDSQAAHEQLLKLGQKPVSSRP
jgi:protein O-mannosyl-transferase